MKTQTILLRVRALLFVATPLLWAIALHGERLPIERLQREFQARHHYVSHYLADRVLPSYAEWPPCRKTDGQTDNPPPFFPKDGYYGDLDTNPDKAVELVQDLKTKFFATTQILPYNPIWVFSRTFAKASLVEGSAEVSFPYYSLTDFDQNAFTDINVTNYRELFHLLETYIQKLTHVRIDRTTPAVTYTINREKRVGAFGISASCATAMTQASANWLAAAWTADPNNNGISLAAASFLSGGTSFAQLQAVRARIYADFRDLRGSGQLYLLITSYEGAPYSNNPKVTPDQKWHLVSDATMVPGDQEFYYPPLDQPRLGDAQPVFAAGQTCPPTLATSGWYLGGNSVGHVFIFRPDFYTEPDPDDCCVCTDGCEPGQPTFKVRSVQINIGLGSDNYGGSAGGITLSAELPNPSLATLSALRYSVASTVEAVPELAGRRQYKTSQALFNLQVNDSYKYTISVYSAANIGTKDGNGFYQTTGPASSTMIVENPDASPTVYNRLKVTQTKGASSTVTEYVYTVATGEWLLLTGNSLRKESRTSTWNSDHTLRTETILIKSSTDQVIYKEVNTHQLFAWGPERIQQVVDPGGAALTSTWTFYANPATDGGAYSRLKEEVGAYGNWAQYYYDAYGRESKQVTQFRDSATGSADNLNRVVAWTYSSSDPQITIIESLLGQEVARRYQVVHAGEVQDIVCQRPGANWQISVNPDNLVTTTKRYASGPFVGEVQSIENPDGTMQFYTYDVSGGVRTDRVDEGQPNGGKTAIVDGTKTVTVVGSVGQSISRIVTDIASSLTLSTETYSNHDEFNRPRRVTYLDGTYTDTQYGCCGVDTTTDRDGVLTQYLYDGLKRQYGYTRLGITYQNVLDADGRILVQKRTGTDNTQIILGQALYDLAGRLIKETNALNGITTHAESLNGSGQRVRTTTYPDNGTRITAFHKDGQSAKITGTSVVPAQFEYDVELDGSVYRSYVKETRLDGTGSATTEWVKVSLGSLGRPYKFVYADATPGITTDNPFSQLYFNNKGQLARSVDPDGITILYQYNSKGELEYSATDINPANTTVDVNGNYSIDFTADRVARAVNEVINNATLGYNVRRSQLYAYPTPSSGTPLLIAKQEFSTDGLRSWRTAYPDPSTPVVTASQTQYNNNDGTTAAGYRTTTLTQPDGSKMVVVYFQGRLLSMARKSSGNLQITKTSYSHDPHGRQATITDARNGATTLAYNNADLITTATTPIPSFGQPAQIFITEYDTMFRAWRSTQPDGTTVTREFFPSGLIKKTYGSHGASTYPVDYTYDHAGRMKTMKTWQDSSTPAGTATTTWEYNQYRGWLEKKIHQGETDNTLDFEYYSSGRLWKRHWERPTVTTTYAYNTAGDLDTLDYSDTTPDVTYGYDRRGRRKTITQGSMVTTLTFNDANERLTEHYDGGALDGLTVTSGYDAYMRRASLTLNSQPTALSYAYGYDAASRLSTVSAGTHNATYGYLANSTLANEVTFRQNTAPRLTTTKSFDSLNRLIQLASTPSAAAAISTLQAYNSGNQLARVSEEDGSYWDYDYDTHGQVRNGRKYFQDGQPVPGQQFEYQYDDIGNRTSTKAGGDENGANLRTTTYSPDLLNRYVNRTVPGTFDVTGLALGNNSTLLVNGQVPWRKAEYFRKELSVNNSSTPQWPLVTVTASGETTVNRNMFVPTTPEITAYDADGNLTGDGRWTYEWDAENRLKVVRSLAGSPAPERRLVFEYDASGRRIRKTVWNDRDDGQGSELADTIYVYDGWNLIAELDANNSGALKNNYIWGLDLSGSERGAGGVGGLLFVTTAGTGTKAVACDGNGNVEMLVDATTGAPTARYDYGPFGEPLRVTGSDSGQPFRFSTKFFDEETGLIMYPARPYSASLGRWLSRDPIGEWGGLNLYGFVGNNSVNAIDPFGNVWYKPWTWLEPVFERPFKAKANLEAHAAEAQFAAAHYERLVDQEMLNPNEAYDFHVMEGIFGIDPNRVQTAGNMDTVKDVTDLTVIAGHTYVTLATMVTPTAAGAKCLTLGTKTGETAAAEVAAKEGANLKPYGGKGGGHHVPAKSGFENAPGYHPNTAPAIPNEELARLGLNHDLISGAQQTLYREFAKTGEQLTWEAMHAIETQALVRGGAEPGMAAATVTDAIARLQAAGVTGPTRIPWAR